ncbi:putative fructosyl amino acid protein [Parathielavia hyrcaniae]|uniref:Fructosyl amino acid protein n=1 Tax=Parathielavia hyrcaniae TaxID=113614 RepID=A0AAN6PZ04_9PEZI|nr:putative fructosyl amino acid protein [Parathielavia hyrcaniae]
MAPAASSSPPPSSLPFSTPSSVLIVGSGVFGLSTALALTHRDAFAHCSITVVDRSDLASQSGTFPSPDASSIDASRVIRADYADPDYVALGDEAQVHWRKQDHPTDLGAQGRYHETGVILVGHEARTAPAAAPPADGGLEPKPMTGMDYVRLSWANVLSRAAKDPELAARVRELPDAEAIRDALGTGGSPGTWGYINHTSGWANAAASMAWLLDRVQQTGRVSFTAGTVVSLEHDETSVTGAKLSDGRVLSADLVVVAAGAWTAGLVDMGGQGGASGQVMAYLDLTQAEQDKLANIPTFLNLSSGHFIIPPTDRVLKVARHAYGYRNPTTPANPPLPLNPATAPPATVSVPRTFLTDPSLAIPPDAELDLRHALGELIPWLSLHDRPFSKTRMCWYLDTATGDFLIDHHPYWRGLFVATGDSGHAFKFLPILGEKVVDCIVGDCPAEFRGKWDWTTVTTDGSGWDVYTDDGSREHSTPGLRLANVLAE